ncbi:glutaredoxin-C9-like [Capsicum annuum]|uniref:glutaredoxin-C9-like n=1 Tax=Capsicum annuum TaxID=4072 RepID=UPI001FB162C4|nr:glutaredoxin-C9-like [Capsicum annuum]
MHRTSAGRFSVTPTAGGSNSGESRMPPGHPSNRRKGKAIIGFDKLIVENAILIVSMRECCMCALVKSLLVSLGVNPMIFKVDEEEKTSVLIKLIKMNEVASSDTGEPWELPAVYIRGKDIEGADKVMESHVNIELVPMLREAGALWL